MNRPWSCPVNRRHSLSVIAWLVLVPLLVFAVPPSLKVPVEVRGEPGEFLRVPADTTGKVVRWIGLDKGLSVFPTDLLKDSKTGVVIATRPGRYRLMAITCLADELSDPVICTVVVGDVPPGPVPPDPVPPGPTPPVPPVPPPPPAPIPVAGFRVLIIEETADRPRLPVTQMAVLFSKTIRDYLDRKCVVGNDGKTREWRIWDKDTDASAEARHWGEALKRPRKDTPWIVISDGKTGYEGPLPANVEATMTLLRQYGGE